MARIYSKICVVCGKIFEARVHNGLYCSKLCKYRKQNGTRRKSETFKRWREKNLEREHLRAREYHRLKYATDPEYVERKRRNSKEYKLKNPLNGPMNHDKEHFNGNKLPTMERDSFTCQVCMFKGNGYVDHRLAVHHKDGNRENNNLENLITLCDKCHKVITGYQTYKRYVSTIINKRLIEQLAEKLQ